MILSKLYLRLALLALVIGPIVWLMFTEDGRRRTDLVMLDVAGHPSVHLNLAALDGEWTEQQVLAALAGPQWQCGAGDGKLGERLCFADIGGFNGVPGRYLSLFFASERLRAVKVGYRIAYHDWLKGRLKVRFGPPSGGAESSVLSWETGHGTLALPRRPEGEDAALFWVAGEPAR